MTVVLVDEIRTILKRRVRGNPIPIFVYGVRRGGIHVAQEMLRHDPEMYLVEEVSSADVIVDDIEDSSATRMHFERIFPGILFRSLIKREEGAPWITFPWERMQHEMGPEDNVRRILEYIGEDTRREGLVDTPDRVVRSYKELFSGYGQDPKKILKTFSDGACDQMVVLKDIEFYSTCEHHMQPFAGRAAIGYLPKGRVVGISKLARLLEVFSRRLQIQERIGEQVTQALMDVLDPKGAGCILSAQHFCMTCRGVNKQNSVMVTSSLRGAFRDSPEARAEFLRMAGF